MRLVIQRVCEAEVSVEKAVVGTIEAGLLVFLGVERGDEADTVAWAVKKISGLRIFEDARGKMNLSLLDTGGAVLLISQFTLLGDVRKGRRPAFTAAAKPELADRLYQAVAIALREAGLRVSTGVFGAQMKVALLNDGPVTILLDSRRCF